MKILFLASVALCAQPSIQILSPAEGTVFAPGQTITLTAKGFEITSGIVASELGFTEQVFGNVLRFSIPIPAKTTPKPYTLTLMGLGDGGPKASAQVTITVERPDPRKAINSPSTSRVSTATVLRCRSMRRSVQPLFRTRPAWRPSTAGRRLRWTVLPEMMIAPLRRTLRGGESQRVGVTTDDASVVLLRFKVNFVGERLRISLNGDGRLAEVRNGEPMRWNSVTYSPTPVTVTAVSTSRGPMAFALYRPPSDFARDASDYDQQSRSVGLGIESLDVGCYPFPAR